MKKLLTFTLVFALALTLGYGNALAGDDILHNGKHYNLNIIGFAQCTKKDASNPDCFKGNAGDIITHGHTLFVPLKMETYDACATDGSPDGIAINDEVTVGWLDKGVKIYVSDGDNIIITDRDATDGVGRFTLPYGEYVVYARPLGKPDGCMDIDTIICEDEEEEQISCNDTSNIDKYILVGHLDVDRTRDNKKPHWQNATNDLLPEEVGIDGQNYLDFIWQVFNNNLRLLQLRFYKIN